MCKLLDKNQREESILNNLFRTKEENNDRTNREIARRWPKVDLKLTALGALITTLTFN